MPNFLYRLGQGQISLVITYWVFGVAGAMVWGAAFRVLQPQPIRVLGIVMLAAMALYFVFVYVAIWRAANHYQGSALWAILAKLAVVVGAVCTFLPTLVWLVTYAPSNL